jgi:hypothetical protein
MKRPASIMSRIKEILGLETKIAKDFPGINAALPAISRRAERLDPKQ